MIEKKKMLAIELDPPPDDDISNFMEGARLFSEAGADIITIADCPIGRPRADSCMLAAKIKRELGVEALPHMTCRDRNLNATHALLLGLSIEGIRDVLIVTGDPIPKEVRETVKCIFNFGSVTLMKYISELNEATFKSPMTIYGALNVNSLSFDSQLEHARDKIEVGCKGFLTQPVLSDTAIENIKRAGDVLDAKILGGIYPPVSYNNAVFMNEKVHGVSVGEDIIAMYEGLDRQEGERLGEKIALDMARKIHPYVDGYYLMTPFKRITMMTNIIEAMKQEGLLE